MRSWLLLFFCAGLALPGADRRAGLVRAPAEEGPTRQEPAPGPEKEERIPKATFPVPARATDLSARTVDLQEFLASLPGEGEVRRLSRRRVLETVLNNHLRIRIAGERFRVSQAEAQEEDAVFDPALFGRVLRGESRIPSTSAFAQPSLIRDREDRLEVGVAKAFRQGMELSGSLRADRFSSNSTFQGLQPEYDTNLALTLVQPLLAGAGRLSATAEAESARLFAEADFHRYVEEAAQVTAGSEILYWRLVGTVEILQLRRRSLERVQRLLEDTRARLEAGLIPISEVRQAESALAQRRDDLTRARRRVEEVVDTLATNLRIAEDVRVWELPITTEPLPEPPEDLPALEPLLALAREQRAELEAAAWESRGESLEARAARRDRRPQLDLVADVELLGLSGNAIEVPDFQGGGTIQNPFGGSPADSFDRLVEGDFRDWAVGLEFRYPLGNRAARARHARELHEAREAELRRLRLEDQVRFQVLQAHKDLAAGMERARVDATFVELARRAESEERERLREGLSDTLRVLELQDDLLDAEARRIDALVTIQQARVELDLAVGRYLESRDLSLDQAPLSELWP